MSQPKPSILLVHSDQHRYDCIGVHGHPLVRTPNLDRLAQAGADFPHAFTPSPICSPARASLLTGTWPATHGCIDIPYTEAEHPSRADLPNLWRLLGDAGYRQGLFGKYHSELPGCPADHGVDEALSRRDYLHWRAAKGRPPPPASNGWFGDVDCGVKAEETGMAWLADRAIDFLRRTRAEGRPFFLRYDPDEPHLPCRPPAEYAALYSARSIPPWSSFPDPLEGKPAVQRRQHRMWGTGGWSWERWQPVVARYLAEITLLDAQVGRLLAVLDELGLAENTLVIYTTDHGDFCGGHGLMDKHFAMYDDLLRVPLLMRFPGRIAPGVKPQGFVTHEIDLARTILGVADVAIPPTFVGQDLIAQAGGTEPARADIYAQYQGAQSGLYSARMVRDRNWKYVWNPTAETDELYDLDADPGEICNRIDDPGLAGEAVRLRKRLVAWMEEARDPLLSGFTRMLLDPDAPAPPPIPI